MKLNIQLFGIFRDRIGQSVISFDAPDTCKAKELKAMLEAEYPIIKEVQHYMLAVNQEYTNDESFTLSESDEIALIPPIAGG